MYCILYLICFVLKVAFVIYAYMVLIKLVLHIYEVDKTDTVYLSVHVCCEYCATVFTCLLNVVQLCLHVCFECCATMFTCLF